jgi:hypothetical protein
MSYGGESDSDSFQNDPFDDFDFDSFINPDRIGNRIDDDDEMNIHPSSPPQGMSSVTLTQATPATTAIAAVMATATITTVKRDSLSPDRPRKQYGQGIDAKRTAIFRHYRIQDSYVVRQIACLVPVVTRQVLMNLISDALQNCGDLVCPSPPTRDQRRVKAGLVSWIDHNTAFMSRYLFNRNRQ